MDEKQLRALANELAKNLKVPDDLNRFDRLLKKISVEAPSMLKCPIKRMAPAGVKLSALFHFRAIFQCVP